MSSIRSLNQRVILFVGRPLDSRKGLCLLLEAVCVLEALSGIPNYSLWIIGGSPHECRAVDKLIKSQPVLAALKQQARIFVWGRVENQSLAEFYSRATATIIPSHREEFGIVAVEAMMCGCPVIASETGGLANIVEHGKTGILFPPDDALALAAAIAGYLRNNEMVDLHGESARRRALALFAQQTRYACLAKLYTDLGESIQCEESSRQTSESSPVQPEALFSADKYKRLTEIFGTKLCDLTVPTHGKHPALIFSVDNQRYVAKFFDPRASLQASVFPSRPGFEIARGGLIAYARTIYSHANEVAPAIVFYEESPTPLVIAKWYNPITTNDLQTLDNFVLNASRQCQLHKPIEPCSTLEPYIDALLRFSSEENEHNLHSMDAASANVNSKVTGGRLVLCRTHPQVELRRIRLLMKGRTWPLPPSFSSRAALAIDCLLRDQETITESPRLANADMKRDHFLCTGEGIPILADFEHSRYAVGPLDAASWIVFSGIRAVRIPNATHVMSRVRSLYDDPVTRYACICWIVAESLFLGLLSFSQGKLDVLKQVNWLLRDLPLEIVRDTTQ
jgi:hypothetical protein